MSQCDRSIGCTCQSCAELRLRDELEFARGRIAELEACPAIAKSLAVALLAACERAEAGT